ncbi:MAG TPA: DUF3108 domain-containing protein [Pyrinomonadaceae bacterium]|jgi:hypothetical protein|nr:DUF3108 domain-containing protein [Pyrinomonadaceae bacterium]
MPPRRFRKFVALALLCAFVSTSIANASDLTGEHTQPKAAAPLPFEPTEQLVYEGEFSKLLLRGIKIAELRFTAGRTPEAKTGDATAATDASKSAAAATLLFTGDVESKGWFRKLFGINFRFHAESTVAPDSFNIMRTTKTDEQGKRVRTSEAVFDRAGNKIEWTERDPNDAQRPPRVVTSPLEGASHDIISALYFLRTQPLAPGKTFDLVVSDSGAVYHIPAKVVAEKKKMKSVIGKASVVRIDIDLFGEGRPVEGKGKMSLWVTNDDRRLPLRAKLSNDMGTLEINLKSVNKTPDMVAAAQ